MRPGRIGVHLFFVISGFLITGILLDSRQKALSTGASTRHVLKAFFVRRLLRIFPLYYAVILIAALLGVEEINDWLAWNLTYTSNVRDSLFGEVEHYRHFWSLCIEEQFYLTWPFLLLFVPRRSTASIVVAALVAYPIYVGILFHFDLQNFVYSTPLGALNTLGSGALLALLVRDARCKEVCQNVSPFLAVVLTGLYLLLITSCYSTSLLIYLFQSALMAVTLLAIVAWAAQPGESIVARGLMTRPLQFVGTISYGIYLLHPFVPVAVRSVLSHFGFNTAATLGKLQLPFFLLATIGIASLSWYLFEKPINKFKKHFPYVPKT